MGDPRHQSTTIIYFTLKPFPEGVLCQSTKRVTHLSENRVMFVNETRTAHLSLCLCRSLRPSTFHLFDVTLVHILFHSKVFSPCPCLCHLCCLSPSHHGLSRVSPGVPFTFEFRLFSLLPLSLSLPSLSPAVFVSVSPGLLILPVQWGSWFRRL